MDIKKEQSMEQTILEVAERLFLEKGFAMTSTTEIAKAVGCNQALVHYYFRTKDNLFNSIFEKKFKMLFEHLYASQNLGNIPFLEKVRYAVESHFDLLTQNPKLPLLVATELSRLPENLKNLRNKLQAVPFELFTKLNNELQQEIAEGRARKIELIDIIITMVTLNAGLFMLLPIASGIMQLDEEQTKELLAHRREENVQVILNYIKP
ncbi:MAG TPA: TetR/AcrR family transcriptional regulator [Paludibacter sp.]|nr:TetR/AcrR family transcriptional regulator [Paludibacter sp.]